jgi:ATP-dependent Clp protease ATP-binding subunit ClpX
VDTKNILFICGGTFSHLNQIIERRLGKRDIGFHETKTRHLDRNNIISKVETEDLVKFGMIPEFVGRFPIVCALNPLTEKDMLDILTKPKNAITKQYQKFFEMEGVELRFSNDALEEIVKEAIRKGTGARGLRAILEDVMMDTMYDLPNFEDVEACLVSRNTIFGREKPTLVEKKRMKKIA